LPKAIIHNKPAYKISKKNIAPTNDKTIPTILPISSGIVVVESIVFPPPIKLVPFAASLIPKLLSADTITGAVNPKINRSRINTCTVVFLKNECMLINITNEANLWYKTTVNFLQ
jgi:hypothetical protein